MSYNKQIYTYNECRTKKLEEINRNINLTSIGESVSFLYASFKSERTHGFFLKWVLTSNSTSSMSSHSNGGHEVLYIF